MAYGKLGTAISIANTDVVVYTVPVNSKYAECFLNILNTNTVDAIVSVAITSLATPVVSDYIEQGAVVPANGGILTRTDLVCSPGEKIVINANNANCVVRVNGKEIIK